MVDTTKDIDPDESREWLEALESVLRNEGVERGHYLIERLIDKGAALRCPPPLLRQNRVPEHHPRQ